MNPDDFKPAWQGETTRTRLGVDADLLVDEVRRQQRAFAAMIFWRDVREVGVALVLVPVWIILGVRGSLPWTWYLMVPALLYVGGYMLVGRRRQGRLAPGPGEPLRPLVAGSLAQVEHQIWLLRHILRWYLLPIALPALAFVGQVVWREQERTGGWLSALIAAGMLAGGVAVGAAVYWLNQYAVRAELEPRRQELATLLASLDDEAPTAG